MPTQTLLKSVNLLHFVRKSKERVVEQPPWSPASRSSVSSNDRTPKRRFSDAVSCPTHSTTKYL
jgi:hypothetical protein